MSKRTKKKRNKKYSGSDSASAPEKVTRISVPNRSPLGKFWHENKKRLRRWAIFALFVVLAWTVLT